MPIYPTDYTDTSTNSTNYTDVTITATSWSDDIPSHGERALESGGDRTLETTELRYLE